jgi:ATP phosphoribosyltransferase regulatory subunit
MAKKTGATPPDEPSPEEPKRGGRPAKRPGRPADMETFFENLMGPMETWPDPDAEEEFDADPVGDMLELFAESGAVLVSPSILQPADPFLDTVGEDIRRRLFMTEGPSGEAMCLRPEFTIPVCLDYLRSPQAGRPEALAYMGPVFRQRTGEVAEFPQAGVERFGDADAIRTDADLLKLAVDAVETFGLVEGEIRAGDEGLFAAVIDSFDLTLPARRRLRAAFGDPERMERTIAALVDRDQSDLSAQAGFLAAIANGAGSARAVVEDLLAIAGIAAVGTRSAAEIAARFLEKAAAGGGLGEDKARVLRAFLAIEGTPSEAEAALASFAAREGIALDGALDRFRARNAAIRETGLDLDAIRFATRFGRNPDYYTGFMFEIFDPDRGDGKPIAGGGRYDGLLQRLGAAEPIPAAGFSIWLDRLLSDVDGLITEFGP